MESEGPPDQTKQTMMIFMILENFHIFIEYLKNI